MASRLATNFRKSAEGGVTTYSFTDIAEGTGIIVFYGADTNDNGTRSYFLTTNAVYSDKILTYGNGTSGTEKVLDLDFDTPALNLPKNVKGTFRAAIPLIVGHETNANVTGEVYAVVKLRKVSGGVETEIASNTSSTDVIEDDGTVMVYAKDGNASKAAERLIKRCGKLINTYNLIGFLQSRF